jgi:ribosomal peptide maturation radical SAM protein 1
MGVADLGSRCPRPGRRTNENMLQRTGGGGAIHRRAERDIAETTELLLNEVEGDRGNAGGKQMKVALVAMPWFWAHMPSIQLAVVKDIFSKSEVESDVFEFYADFADLFGVDLYGKIANTGTFLGERLFSQFYFDTLRNEPTDDLPPLLFDEPMVERYIMRFGTPLVDHFLDQCVAGTDWSSYDAICLTLTAQQAGASMAFARRLRAAHPDVRIVAGGAGCAGEMGRAMLEVCTEFDIAVHGEAEAIVPRLARALAGSAGLEDVPGISWRDKHGTVSTNVATKVHTFAGPRDPLNFDAYFERVERLPNLSRLPVWIPFESSRGCWYGEKAQCTFCGLNEIIKFRQRDTRTLFEEIDHYATRYGRANFFAVDLIMPRSFFDDFLPQVIASGRDWTIFYEVKSNMRREEVDLLARAGVRWIQPGIESLNDHVLKLMRKGVSAAHNVQALRLSAEMGVTVSWNLISNFPQETPEDYQEMRDMFAHLHHLDPPSGIAAFEVHRFSPFHDSPEQHGVRLKGPHRKYELVFPIDRELLSRLVYRFEYELIAPDSPALAKARDEVADVVEDWKRENSRGARFEAVFNVDGGATLIDSRRSETPIEIHIPAEQAALLRFLDEMQPAVRLCAEFEREEPLAFQRLGSEEGVRDLVERWSRSGVVLATSGMILALPLRRQSIEPGVATPHQQRLLAV